MQSASLHAGKAVSTPSSRLSSSMVKAPFCLLVTSGMRRALLMWAGRCTHLSYITRSQRDPTVRAVGDKIDSQTFHGVHKTPNGRYEVHVSVDGVSRYFGKFDSGEEAARHRDMLLIRFYGIDGRIAQALSHIRLNYPLPTYRREDIMALKSLQQYRKQWAEKELLVSANKIRKLKKASRFHGVTWNSASDRWLVNVRTPGKRVHVGYYTDEEEAARAHDEMAYRLLGDQAVLNFPQDIEQYKIAAAGPAPVLRKKKTSQYLGVSYHRQAGRWWAQLKCHGKHVFWQFYDTEEEAARAYDDAVMRLLPEADWATKLNFKDSLQKRPPQ